MWEKSNGMNRNRKGKYMTGLLELKEYLKNFYAKYEVYLKPSVKFLMALVSLITINISMGYMSVLGHPALVLVVALMCSFMPKNFIPFYVIN